MFLPHSVITLPVARCHWCLPSDSVKHLTLSLHPPRIFSLSQMFLMRPPSRGCFKSILVRKIGVAQFPTCRLPKGIEANQELYQLFIPKIAVAVRNDQMLKVTTLKFKPYLSFGFGSNPRLSVGVNNFITKVPYMGRLLS